MQIILRTCKNLNNPAQFPTQQQQQRALSFDTFFSSLQLDESPPRDLQITAYK